VSSILAIHNSHNASICEIKDDSIIYFQEAERLDRNKKSSNWQILLEKYKGKNFDKIIFVNTFEHNKEVENLVKKEIYLKNIKCSELIFEVNHHFFHACSAFFNSGLKNSYALVIDGYGSSQLFNDERDGKVFEIVSLYYFHNNKFKEIFKVFESDTDYKNGKHIFLNTISLGNMYHIVKNVLGFKEEGSVMALSSYVQNKNVSLNLFVENQYNHFTSVQNAIVKLNIILNGYNKKNPQYLCKSIQKRLEEIVLKYVSNIIKNKKRNLCVSGGVFQNTVLNSKILDICPNLYVDPFADDSGLSMGAALWYSNKNKNKKIDNLCLGDLPDYNNLPMNKGTRTTPKEVAEFISKGNIIAIYQGKNELGKRALGNRSFLFDPRDRNARDKINLLKHREWFRPTAGTVLHEKAHEWFDLKSKEETPFMSYVFNVKKQDIPGVTHIDNTCRIQTLKKEQNFHYYNLINEFYKITDVPILLNTSFNLAGQPLVNSIFDAVETLENSEEKFNIIYFPEIGKVYEIKDFI